jgi:hypothetical protein
MILKISNYKKKTIILKINTKERTIVRKIMRKGKTVNKRIFILNIKKRLINKQK